MSNHTPGPWTELTGIISGPNGDEIAEVVGGDGMRYLDDDVNAECAANARLIAAAPELLESLIECVEALKHTQNTMGIRVNPPTTEKAKAAIAKATGKPVAAS